MATRGPVSSRRDAGRNRERLIAAARTVFAARGAEVPLEEIARAAQVSRATLYRNFATREELAATVFEDNVVQIEERAAAAGDAPDAVVDVYDFALDMQLANPGLARVLSRTDTALFTTLSNRVATAFVPLLARGRAAALVHPDVDVSDLMRTLPMAAAALIEDDVAGRPRSTERVRVMMRRALFTFERSPGTH